jgi:ABC-2 type transport system ATP-binding protein
MRRGAGVHTGHTGQEPVMAGLAEPDGWVVAAGALSVRAGRRVAVDGVDLALGNGVHGLLGPNGAGKTTLVRALATVLRPSAGTLRLLGRAAGDRDDLREVRRRIGYLPQEVGFYRGFTVREFVEYLAWLKEVPAAQVPGAVQRAIERVGLADRADHKLKTLSGGMRRRAGIAQAIVNDPRLLLLDEPTAGLDPDQRMRFRALLRELAADTCVVVATHLVEDVAAACTGTIVLDEGRVAFRGTPADLAAAASDPEPGDRGDRGEDEPGSPAERGYSAVMRRHQEQAR